MRGELKDFETLQSAWHAHRVGEGCKKVGRHGGFAEGRQSCFHVAGAAILCFRPLTLNLCKGCTMLQILCSGNSTLQGSFRAGSYRNLHASAEFSLGR